jgi:hypothetical protein
MKQFERDSIMKILTSDEISRILKMPETVSKGFFDTMLINMHEREDLNLFKRQSGRLSMRPYTSI